MSMEGMKPEPISDFLKNSKMYEISGQDPISIHSFKRYIKDKERDDDLIKEISLKISKIRHATKEELVSFIQQGLADPNPEVQIASARMIEGAQYEKRASLIEKGLASLNPKAQKASAEMIKYASYEKRASLIKQGLESFSLETQKASAGMIEYTSQEEQDLLQEILLKKIKQGLANSSLEAQKASVEMIWWTPKIERVSLVQQGLNNPNSEVRRVSAKMIVEYSSYEEQASLRKIVFQKIQQGLTDPNPKVQKASVEMIEYARIEERTSLIKQGLNNPNPEVQIASARMIKYAPEKERTSLIEKGLASLNPKVQKASTEMIKYAREEERNYFIKQCLANLNPEVQIVSARMTEFAPEEKQEALFNLVIEKGLGKYLIKAPLYINNDVVSDKFSRTNFDKTGSETILIGGTLKNKIILRRITPEAFLVWQRAYEDYELWKNAGFDYVPIEPIQSFNVNKDGLVDVYSGVLDLNFNQWIKKTSIFKKELLAQTEKIKEILESQNIEHGHPDFNFCLRFFRDEKGEPDFKRTPRVYLIDFDQAVSPGEWSGRFSIH